MFFHVEDEMIRLASEAQDRIGNDYIYYCSSCDWYYKPSEVDDKKDGISDVPCPECDAPLQNEGDENEDNNN